MPTFLIIVVFLEIVNSIGLPNQFSIKIMAYFKPKVVFTVIITSLSTLEVS